MFRQVMSKNDVSCPFDSRSFAVINKVLMSEPNLKAAFLLCATDDNVIWSHFSSESFINSCKTFPSIIQRYQNSIFEVIYICENSLLFSDFFNKANSFLTFPSVIVEVTFSIAFLGRCFWSRPLGFRLPF